MSEDLVTVSGHGAFRQIVAKREINAPIERVWRAITRSDEVAHWWVGGIIEAREGGRVRLGVGGENCDGDGPPLDGTVKVCIEPHIFEFTWHDDYPEAGLVRFDLVALEGDRTLVTLVQNVPAGDVIPATAGWHELIERLAQYGATGEPVPAPQARGDGNRFDELQAIYRAAGVR